MSVVAVGILVEFHTSSFRIKSLNSSNEIPD